MRKWSVKDEARCNRDSILNLFVGKRIGRGASRHVYELIMHPDRVLKVEHTGWSFHNQTEWLIWKTVKVWPISDWFAPCYDIDSIGNTLIQARTKPFECEKDFKEALRTTRGGVIPSVFDDIHYGNFGMFDGRVTCHDYGYHRFFEQIAREMSIEAGYISIDEEPADEPFDVAEGGQLALNL